jgi:hypothetical protein
MRRHPVPTVEPARYAPRQRGRLISLGYHKKPRANQDGSRAEGFVEFELLMEEGRPNTYYRFRDNPDVIVAAETWYNSDSVSERFTVPVRDAGQAFGDRFATSGRTDTVVRVPMPEPEPVWVDVRPEQCEPAFDQEPW